MSVITLDLNELVILLGVNARFGLNMAELPSPCILRQEGATESADRSLTLLADVRASSKAVLADTNLRGTRSRGSNGALTSARSTSVKSHCGVRERVTDLSLLTLFRKRFIKG